MRGSDSIGRGEGCTSFLPDVLRLNIAAHCRSSLPAYCRKLGFIGFSSVFHYCDNGCDGSAACLGDSFMQL